MENTIIKRTYDQLRASVYMGHKCVTAIGKPLTWQALQKMSLLNPGKQMNVLVGGTFYNRVYTIQ